MYIYIYIYIYIHTFTYISRDIDVYIYIYIFIYLFMACRSKPIMLLSSSPACGNERRMRSSEGWRVLLTEIPLTRIARQGTVCLNSIVGHARKTRIEKFELDEVSSVSSNRNSNININTTTTNNNNNNTTGNTNNNNNTHHPVSSPLPRSAPRSLPAGRLGGAWVNENNKNN